MGSEGNDHTSRPMHIGNDITLALLQQQKDWEVYCP